jgi:outer membrane protein assembly factor BamB
MTHEPYRINSGRFLCAFLLAILIIGRPAARADWPDFRGPRGDGHVSAPGDTKLLGLPLRWSETNNIKWKTEIPYKGWSTPANLADHGDGGGQ